MATRSPLAPVAMKTRAWAAFSRADGKIARAWGSLAPKLAVREAAGAEAEALVGKIRAAGGIVRELPRTWMALPTGFDLQVHLRYPGQADRETLEGGLESALAGGFDTIVTMPNTNPFLDDPKLLANAAREVDAKLKELQLPLKVYFTGSGTQGMKGESPADIAGLARAGAIAITDDGWGVRSPEAMRRIFELCAAADLPFLQHAEMPGHKGHASPSEFQKNNGIPAYPRTAESEMVKRDLELLKTVPGARYHVLHVSTRETLREIRRGKEAGLNVTCEVTPHHLIFANTDIPAADNALSTSFKMNPPLFAPEDREALIAALNEGLIDCVSTDHAPHAASAKRGTWTEAPFGTRGLETALPALLTLHAKGKLSKARLLDAWTVAARKIVDAAPATGVLFVDPDREYIVDAGELPGISPNSCFLGKRLRGRIEMRGDSGSFHERA